MTIMKGCGGNLWAAARRDLAPDPWGAACMPEALNFLRISTSSAISRGNRNPIAPELPSSMWRSIIGGARGRFGVLSVDEDAYASSFLFLNRSAIGPAKEDQKRDPRARAFLYEQRYAFERHSTRGLFHAHARLLYRSRSQSFMH